MGRAADDARVRLESDTRGGELHVRADVTAEGGRAQSFRSLAVHVAGPGGFSREVSLEAVGAGRYAATVPVTRHGTYVVAARDEATGERGGTTSTVLSAGEELASTGSDRELLARRASATGVVVRPSLAGVFEDRVARRFSYTALTGALLVAALACLLCGVAARRLGMPEWLAGAAARVQLRMRTRREAGALRHAEVRATQAAAQATNTALLAAKERAGAQVTKVDAGARAEPLPPRVAPPTPAVKAPPPVDAPTERPLTTIERLAQKRKERRDAER